MGKYFLAVVTGISISAIATSALAVGPAGLARPTLSPMNIVVKKATLAPLAYVKFCVDNKADCEQGHGEASVDLTPELRRELRQVNFQINRAIVPVNDVAGEDSWQADVASGDCEDYVLTKRKRLIELGWSPNALRIAVTYTPENTGHAVLVVSTSKGDLVLDNRHNAVLDWRDTDLRWIKIQSPDNPLKWNEI
jgi:predicted transglutaminase-like cysteine proteinase